MKKTQKRIQHVVPFKILLAGLLLTLTGKTIVAQTFGCGSVAYLFQGNPTGVYSVDLASGEYRTVISEVIPGNKINAVGFDNIGGYIWGMNQTTKEMVRIDASWNVTSYSNPNLHSSGYFVGDVSPSGIFYLYRSGSIEKFDITNDPPTYEGSITPSPSPGSIHDLAFNPVDGNMYTVQKNGNKLFRIAPSTGATTDLGAVPVLNGVTSAYGAVYFDASGDFYISQNNNGNIYRISSVQNLSPGDSYDGILFTYGPPSGTNDGVKCPESEVSSESCTNTVDDDADSDIDCDDLDCDTNVACVVGGGGGGGLESNDRLAEKIAYRDFWRAKHNVDLEDRTLMPRAKKSGDYGRKKRGFFRNDYSIRSFVPIDAIPNTETFISSPKDLSLLSNAVEVMSVDAYERNRRVGTVLGLKSENGVYEHTKFICDRVKGGKIRDVQYYKLDGEHDFAVTRMSNADGGHELVSLISLYLNEEKEFVLESHWSTDQYPEDKTYYNFHIWANSFRKLEYLVTEILRLVEIQAPVSSYHISDFPDVYVSELGYENEHLKLIVVNPIGARNLDLELTQRTTETAEAEPLELNLDLSGAERDTLLVPTGGLFTVGGKINNDLSDIPDEIYIGGGAWGYFGSENGYQVDEYEVAVSDHGRFGTEAEWVERNVHLKGTLKDELSVFRTLRAAARPVNLTGYNTLAFEVTGAGLLEVVLAKAGVENWADQPRLSFNIDGQCQQVFLSPRDFQQNAGRLAWDDVESISFIQRGDGQTEKPFELNIRNITFANVNERPECSAFNRQELQAFPNPMIGALNILMSATGVQSYDLTFSNHLGQVIATEQGETDGAGRLVFRKPDLTPGMYYYTVKVESGSYSGKVMVGN